MTGKQGAEDMHVWTTANHDDSMS